MSIPYACRLVPFLVVASLPAAQTPWVAKPVGGGGACPAKTAIEFVAPMPSEEVPLFHPVSPTPDSFHVILEIALEQKPGALTPVREGATLPSPGAAAVPPTDVDGDGLIGDVHPALPGLSLVMDDDLFVGGFVLPAGTELASLFELIGSEVELGGDQTTTVSWILDPTYMIVDLNGDLGTNLTATINGVVDTVFLSHGFDPLFNGVHSVQTPTISIWVEDWHSTVDSDVAADQMTPFLVGVEVRIPCYFDFATVPPTPHPLDPIFGPCQGGAMACTGNWPLLPGPGFHPMFPSLDVRFSDDYFDVTTGTFVAGGVITGGQCGVIWGSTGASLAYAFRQSSVHAWYGVNGFPDTTPLGGGDDQLIYRFTMLADGQIFDTDVLPDEMLITAAIESTTNCFSITNVRVKHRPDVTTPDPGP